MRCVKFCRAIHACVIAMASLTASAAYLQGTTDKPFLSYRSGEEMVFTLTPVGMENMLTNGPCLLSWTRAGDDGVKDGGTIPFARLPFVYRTRINKPGFVFLGAHFVTTNGTFYFSKGVPVPPFFAGGAAADVEKLEPVAEPADFDAFWRRQRERLEKVPVFERRKAIGETANARIYAVEVDCAGPRPVTGYLTVPRRCEKGEKVAAKLQMLGYSSSLQKCPADGDSRYVVLTVNAHGMKLPAFGGDEATHKYFEFEIRSNGKSYAFDKEQNRDPETSYFNGMALRVMRALQYLKTLPEWNGKDLWASGGSQGGLQTIWAAGCGEGVTEARCNVIWCCDFAGETVGRHKGGWRVPWSEGLGYYDPVYFGRRIPRTCHVDVFRAGMGDYISPPCGIMMLWNAMKCPGHILFDQGGTHGYVPPAYPGRDVSFTRQ